MRRPLLVCQTGPGIGLGHLSRLRVAARALTEAGLAPHLLVQGGAERRPDDPPWTLLAAGDDLVTAIDGLLTTDPTAPDGVLLDLAGGPRPLGLAAALARWRAQGLCCVGIDGPADLREQLDGLFLPGYRRPPWLADGPGTTPVIWGWDCLLLPPVTAPAPWQPPAVPEVLVLTGGSDATALGAHWPQWLDERLPAGTRLHWVRGPWAAAPRRPALDACRCEWHWHEAPAGLGPLMRHCSHAVTVYGVSAFELLQHGLPTVVFSPYGTRDDAELAGLHDSGLVATARDEREATAILSDLLAKPQAARRLADAARARPIGGGGPRLAEWLTHLHPSAAAAA